MENSIVSNSNQENRERLSQDIDSFIMMIFKRKYTEGTLEYIFIEKNIEELTPAQVMDFYEFIIEEKGVGNYFNSAGFSSLTLFKKAFVSFKEYSLDRLWKDSKLDSKVELLVSKITTIFDILKVEQNFKEESRIKILNNKLSGFKKKGTTDTLINSEEYNILEQTKFSSLFILYSQKGEFGLREEVTSLWKNNITKEMFTKNKILELEIQIPGLPMEILKDINKISKKA